MRDSSDEEWEAAYAAMNPIAQFGWGNRRQEVNEVGATLLRDVFVAADELHADAMSVMDGNTEEEVASRAIGADLHEEGASAHTEGSAHIFDTQEDAVLRDPPVPGMFCRPPTQVVGGGTPHCMLSWSTRIGFMGLKTITNNPKLSGLKMDAHCEVLFTSAGGFNTCW